MFILVKSEIAFDVHVNMAFVLTSTIQSNIFTLSPFVDLLFINVVRNMGQFAYSKRKVASLYWIAYFGMRICGGAQLWSCSHLVDHTITLLTHFSNDFDWSKVFFGG